jgi:hypothetical protein
MSDSERRDSFYDGDEDVCINEGQPTESGCSFSHRCLRHELDDVALTVL